MHVESNSKATGPVIFLPAIFGGVGLVLLGIYQAQRDGLFLHLFYPFDRFVQHHLDAFGELGSLAALLGVVVGVLIPHVCGRSRIVTIRTIISLVALLSILGLSL